MSFDWNLVFDEALAVRGATDHEIDRFRTEVTRPLSSAEVDEVNRSQRNPFRPGDPLYSHYRPFDPGTWTLPNTPLPALYFSFLRFSNGGEFRSGDRWLQFFPALDPDQGVRAMLLAYDVPQYMPGAMPFAFDGSGTFYMFDMRLLPVDGEYPIACAHAGNLEWDPRAYWTVANSFLGVCTGKADIYAIRRGGA